MDQLVRTDHVEVVGRWLSWLADQRNKRPLTIKSYRGTLDSFIREIGRSGFDEVTTEQIERWLQRPRVKSLRPSAATMNRERTTLLAFYRWLQSRDLLSSNPVLDVGVPQVRNKAPRPVPDEVWAPLWDNLQEAEDRAWLGLGYYAGLRRYELATVPPSAFDVDAQIITFLERKGGSVFPVEYGETAATVAEGLPHLDRAADFLDAVAWMVRRREGDSFLAPHSKGLAPEQDAGYFNKRMKTLLRRAGLGEYITLVTPHSLRHSCATNLLRCGVPIELVADQLSHSSIETTRRYLKTSGQLGRWRRK